MAGYGQRGRSRGGIRGSGKGRTWQKAEAGGKVGRSKLSNSSQEQLEAKFGYCIFTEGEPRLGWLLNMTTSSMEDRISNRSFSCVNLYFMCQDGSTFKSQFKYCPYFYLGTQINKEREVDAYLRRRYGEQLASVDRVEKEDLDLKNHLSGLRKTYLRLSFNTVQDLMLVKSDLLPIVARNNAKLEAAEAYNTLLHDLSGKPKDKEKIQDFTDFLTDLREYDVPYHVRFAIDHDVRCGLWYNVSIEASNVKLEHRTDLLQRVEVRVCAFDIETTKLPLKFPDASFDMIMMISYMVDGQGYLIINRECVGEEIEDIEYSPKAEYEGLFKVTNVPNERELLQRWFSHMQDVKPNIYVTYNGDFFDWPFIEKRAMHHEMSMHSEIGFHCDENQGECLSKFACHLDCFAWVKRDSYLPQGSQGLKAVTKVKLGYDPLEINPEDMVCFAKEQPQTMASYSVSDALSTYYLYMTYVHPFIFSLATIIPMSPDEVLRKGSGTLCEMLLMVQAFKGNIICPNKHKSELEKCYKGHLLESETYIGGHVECLESGVFRSDLPTKFRLVPEAYQKLIDNLDRDLRYAIEAGKMKLESVTNYKEVTAQIRTKLEALRDAPIREEQPLIYHLDVAAMYPNIILTNRLQPPSVVTDDVCAACDFNRPEKTCLRKMEWVWRGETYSASRSEYTHLKNQIESESFPSSDGSTQQFFHNLPKDEQHSKLKARLKKYCQKVYKRVLEKPMTELRSANICMRENPFYVDTVRSFRDRRYEYKGLNKSWKGRLAEAKASGNPIKVQEAQDMVILYDSLQLAHKCILNSFYGYVMRKGARWYSMEMAGVVTYTGAKIIQNARLLVEKIGRPLELDTDGIWCALPGSFPENFSFTTEDSKELTFSYPCVMLNVDVALSNTNDQYQSMVDSARRTYITSSECSIEFEVDGPYKAMILPASKEEGVSIKKRYAVFNLDGTLAELKGFEVKRRGELKLIKIFQSEVFENFLHGETIEACYSAVAAVANRWLDFIENQGADVADSELLDYISESSTMSKSLADYGEKKSCATTTARRLADFLGDEMVKDKGLSCRYIIASSSQGAPVSERAIPVVIFETEPEIMKVYLKKWCKTSTDAAIRSIVDWAYYKQRLSSAIQKIITIPAAMQKVQNPVPRVIHPDWLWKKIQQKDDKWRQRNIQDLFGRQRVKNLAAENRNNTTPDIEDAAASKHSTFNKMVRPLVRIYTNGALDEGIETLGPDRPQEQGACEGEPEMEGLQILPDRQSDQPLPQPLSILSPSKADNYGVWLEHKKQKWKEGREKRKRSREEKDTEESAVRNVHSAAKVSKAVQRRKGTGLGAFFRETESALINSHWQVLQFSPTAIPGQFIAWVIAGSSMYKVPLNIPRIFFLNTKAADSAANLGPRVTRQLPHGRPCFNLVEVLVKEEQFRDMHRDLATHLADPEVEGVYETQIPLALHTLLQLGCVCAVKQKSRKKTIREGWSLDDLRMKTTTECSYLLDSLGLFYLYQSLSDNRGFYLLHIHARDTVLVIIVNPFQNKEVTSLQLERYFRDSSRTMDWPAEENTTFRVEYTTNNEEAGQVLQRALGYLRDEVQKPTLGLLECSAKEMVLALVPALGNFPSVEVGASAKDGQYRALGWQAIAARAATQRCCRVLTWFQERLALSQYAHIPVGNFTGDWVIFTADIFFARALRDHQQVLWISNNGLPDIGGHCEEGSTHTEEVQQPALTLPGAYRSISVELKMHHLAVNALLKCNQVYETEGGGVLAAAPEVGGYLQSMLGQTDWDESVFCAPAFQILKTMVQGWLSDATTSGNAFADNLLQHLYRWLCSPQSRLHDPALHRILHKVMLAVLAINHTTIIKVMQKVYALLLLELRKLGATVVFADFSRIIINTGKNDMSSALGYCDYLVKTVRTRDLFEWVELVPHRSWHSLLFMDQYNYGGLEANASDRFSEHDPGQPPADSDLPGVVSCWNIADYLPKEAQDFFILIITEYLYFPWKHERQNLVARSAAQDGVENSTPSLPIAAAIEIDKFESTYLKEQISSYFTDKLLRMVRDLQRKLSGKKADDGQDEADGQVKFAKLKTAGDPALEFIKHTCAVMALDKRVQYDIQVLRKNLLKLVHTREFSAQAMFHEPCRSFTLPNVICSYCNDCRDLDLCRDPLLLEKDWTCRSNGCEQPYDLEWVENSLVQIVRQRERSYQLQDLVCVKCRQVKATHVADQCACGGTFACTETPSDFRNRMSVFLDIATHHGFLFLQECVSWVLTR